MSDRNFGLKNRRAVKLTPLQFARGEVPGPEFWERLEEPRRLDWRAAGVALAVCGPITALLVLLGLYRCATAFGVAAWVLTMLVLVAGVL